MVPTTSVTEITKLPGILASVANASLNSINVILTFDMEALVYLFVAPSTTSAFTP
jgi:hypothetical protein